MTGEPPYYFRQHVENVGREIREIKSLLAARETRMQRIETKVDELHSETRERNGKLDRRVDASERRLDLLDRREAKDYENRWHWRQVLPHLALSLFALLALLVTIVQLVLHV